MSKERKCPVCGMDVSESDAAAIEEDMEYDHKTCGGCGRTFKEIREED